MLCGPPPAQVRHYLLVDARAAGKGGCTNMFVHQPHLATAVRLPIHAAATLEAHPLNTRNPSLPCGYMRRSLSICLKMQ
jgi:hypothetical protein